MATASFASTTARGRRMNPVDPSEHLKLGLLPIRGGETSRRSNQYHLSCDAEIETRRRGVPPKEAMKPPVRGHFDDEPRACSRTPLPVDIWNAQLACINGVIDGGAEAQWHAESRLPWRKRHGVQFPSSRNGAGVGVGTAAAVDVGATGSVLPSHPQPNTARPNSDTRHKRSRYTGPV